VRFRDDNASDRVFFLLFFLPFYFDEKVGREWAGNTHISVFAKNNSILLKFFIMTGIGSEVYHEVNPAKKNAEWANSVIKIHRMNWRSLVSSSRAAYDRSVLYSVQQLDSVKNSFDDEAFKRDTKFIPLPILDALVNAVVEEITQRPPKMELRATDPTAISEKERDIELLKKRKILESQISQERGRVGEPPYKMPYENFNGNVKDFDSMGLDESDAEDVSFYTENFQRLLYEIAGQSVLDNIFKTDKWDEDTIRRLVKDVFALKAISIQRYIDKMTGEIKKLYIDPQICKGVFGNTNDGKGDLCRGWEEPKTVMDWLAMVGNEFDFEKHWRHLLWGINFCGGTKFTGFMRGGVAYDCFNTQIGMEMGLGEISEPNLLDWSSAYLYKVHCGYIEWRSIDATATYLRRNSNPRFAEPVAFDFELKKKKEVKEYYKESYYQQQWYSSYFLATTSTTQWIFQFQKVYFQQLEGANDEYSNGTLCYYQEEGKSAVEIAEPYLQPAHFAFYRMLWLIYKTKPDQEEYLLDEMVTMAKSLKREFPQMSGNGAAPSFENILDQIVQYQRKSHIRIRVLPQVDGKTAQQLPQDGKRPGSGGLDPVAIAMQAVTQWAESQIAVKIGINPMRLGMNPPSRESTQSEENTIQYSLNTTSYMYRMIQYLKQHDAIVILNYAQDIIKYKDSAPYKWLMNLIGNENADWLGVLGKFAAHRMGIFVRDYNMQIEKQQIMQASMEAVRKGTLRHDEWFVINMTEDPKRANAILSRTVRKREKQARDFDMQKLQMQDSMNQRQFEREKELIIIKGQLDIDKEKIRANGYIASAQITAENKIDVKELQNASEAPKIAAKAQAQKEVEATKANLDEQKPLGEAAA
jgi:hypothetical protein